MASIVVVDVYGRMTQPPPVPDALNTKNNAMDEFATPSQIRARHALS